MISNTERAITVLLRMAIIEKSRANLLSRFLACEFSKSKAVFMKQTLKTEQQKHTMNR